ncbi:MAG: glutamate-cysteine ligase family protein [Gemmatimonadaceae bacterium]
MSLSEAQLAQDVRQRLFSPVKSANPHTIGIELELIPLHRADNKPALPRVENGLSTADILSRLARRESWIEQRAEDDPPSWRLPDGACISFEPGGQIEISSAPQRSASVLIDSARDVVTKIIKEMEVEGIELIARGVDPYNGIDAVPLQLRRERYTGMTRYFDSVGPYGVQMMRQTAALQINIDRGEDPLFRWRLLNFLAPVIIALFANSRDYAGAPTEWASYRGHLWRSLDRTRTGVAYRDDDPVGAYLAFALGAVAMRSSEGNRPYREFRDWMSESSVGMDEWSFHLSTLFPEVRAKEFFELRSADTIELESLSAPIAFVTGLVYDAESARFAASILPEPTEKLLAAADRSGLDESLLRDIASRLCVVALEGARRLGETYISRRHLSEAREYLERRVKNTAFGASLSARII